MTGDYSYFFTSIQAELRGLPRPEDGGSTMEKWELSSYRRHVRRIRHERRMLRCLWRRAVRWHSGPKSYVINCQTWPDVMKTRREYVQTRLRTKKPCSCYMCGNTRRYYHAMTPQEWRAELDALEQCEQAGVQFKKSRFRPHS